MDQSQTQLSMLHRAMSGDPLGWKRLTELYRPFITGWARRHTAMSQDAEDLAQEILMQVVRYLPTFEHNGRPGAFRAWLRTLAAHSTSDFWSARDKQPQGTGDSAMLASLQELQDPDSALTNAWNREHDQFIMSRLLEQVGAEFEPQSMIAFRRHGLDGERAEVVARELNLSVGAVYTAKSRVLARLRHLSQGLLDWDE